VDDWLTTLRTLIAFGLALLLVMLRLEAAQFSAAEYDDPIDGRAPSIRRRVSWYGIGMLLVAAILIVHPSPRDDLFLGPGDRPLAIMYGFLYGAAGTAIALGVAYYRYRRLRFPDVWSYPGALLNAVITALIDEVTFRGAIFGLILMTGLEPNAANAIQALLYALATRLGAPGRNRYMLVMAVLVGIAGGWVTAITGGIAAAFLGHAVTRFAVFLSTGHAGQFAPRGREVEEIEEKRRPPKGWRVIGPREREPVSRDR
jgi:Type II CAAX prenyl endopeptidase Rce1-like